MTQAPRSRSQLRLGAALFGVGIVMQVFMLGQQTRFWWVFWPGATVIDGLFPGSVEGSLGYASVVLVLVCNAVLYAAVAVLIVRLVGNR